MTRPFRLEPILRLAQQQKEEAAINLGKLHQQQQLAQEKLHKLQEYRRDYLKQFLESAGSGMDQTHMKNFQAFISRIDEAIQQQLEAIEKARHSVKTGREALLDSERKVKTFGTLEDRHDLAQARIEARKEQREQDEHGMRQAALEPASGFHKL
jgi:flagellar FliJ protein